MQDRNVELVVISDVHLGTFGSQAGKLYAYLCSVKPQTLVLNGDFVDFWQMSRYYWPESHQLVLEKIRDHMEAGTTVYYLPGNHDDVLRRFTFSSLLRLQLVNELELELDGKKAWFIHGDIYDFTMKSRLITKMGAFFYGAAVLVNKALNCFWRPLTGKEVRLSRALKSWVKKKVRALDDFQQTAIDRAVEKQMDYLICGHNHLPEIKTVQKDGRSLLYLNSGDWIESNSALEYSGGHWSLCYFGR